MVGPLDVVAEFASTFKEWHYFVGGGALGFVLGAVFALRVLRAFHSDHPHRRE